MQISKTAPVKIIDIFWQMFYIIFPVFHFEVYIFSVLMATECQLENMKNKNSFFILLYIVTISSSNIKKHFYFNAYENGEVGKGK